MGIPIPQQLLRLKSLGDADWINRPIRQEDRVFAGQRQCRCKQHGAFKSLCLGQGTRCITIWIRLDKFLVDIECDHLRMGSDAAMLVPVDDKLQEILGTLGKDVSVSPCDGGGFAQKVRSEI